MGGASDKESGETDWDVQSDEETLKVALEEARRRYENEVEFINDVDDRAMRGARTGVILLGILVSASAFIEPSTLGDLSPQVTILGVLGISLVFGSMLFALGTYTATEYPTGIGDQHRDAALNDGYSQEEWIEFLINEYGLWTKEVTEMAGANASYLENTMLLQAMGVLSLGLAVSVAYLNRVEDVPPQESLVIFLLILLFGILASGLVFLVRDYAGTLLDERS